MFSLILLALRIFLIGAEVSVAYTSSKLITKHIDLFAAMPYNGGKVESFILGTLALKIGGCRLWSFKE